MTAIERLKRDHAIFRGKLDGLESALRLGRDARFVIRELCFTLSRQLREHIRREGQAAAACARSQPSLGPQALALLAIEHHDEWRGLRSVNRSFTLGCGMLDGVRPSITRVVEMLRDRMERQETQLFPFLELFGMVSDPFSEPPDAQSGFCEELEEVMIGHQVLRAYPETRAVFERFFINIDHEGYYSLDEIAWRHGMASERLLAHLGAAIGALGGSRHGTRAANGIAARTIARKEPLRTIAYTNREPARLPRRSAALGGRGTPAIPDEAPDDR